jgi:hypothetical protein
MLQLPTEGRCITRLAAHFRPDHFFPFFTFNPTLIARKKERSLTA